MRFRRRHRSSLLHRGQSWPRQVLPKLLGVGLIAAMVLFTTNWLFSLVSFGESNQSTGAQLTINADDAVTVSIEGEAFKRAESGLRLYAGDAIATAGGATASLQFFDRSLVRLDENTQLDILRSVSSDTDSVIQLSLRSGSIWFASPKQQGFSGAIVRTVATDAFTATVPAGTEAYITELGMSVFDNLGIGVEVAMNDVDGTIIVGEGQSFDVNGQMGSDPYDLRTALQLSDAARDFVTDSRTQASILNPFFATNDGNTDGGTAESTTDLQITRPSADTEVNASTVEVEGTINTATVSSVQVNGYQANIDENSGTFTLELALPDEAETVISVIAYSDDGETVAEARRTVRRDVSPPEQPTFISPAGNGQTYRTQSERFEIVGEAPNDAVGIIVNDYRLQFFEPGDTQWRYLASTQLGNLQPGTNTYSAVAIKEGGGRSEPVTLTIVLEEGTEGVIDSGSTTDNNSDTDTDTAADDNEPDVVSQSGLPDNSPDQPGTLSVTAPNAGTSFTTNEVEHLIEGTTASNTESLWVNDYRLRLFDPAKTTWSYIASTELGTLKRGDNTYTIVARDADYNIIDRMTYTITLQVQ